MNPSAAGKPGETGVVFSRTWGQAGQRWATHLPAEVRRLGAHLVLSLGLRFGGELPIFLRLVGMKPWMERSEWRRGLVPPQGRPEHCWALARATAAAGARAPTCVAQEMRCMFGPSLGHVNRASCSKSSHRSVRRPASTAAASPLRRSLPMARPRPESSSPRLPYFAGCVRANGAASRQRRMSSSTARASRAQYSATARSRPR